MVKSLFQCKRFSMLFVKYLLARASQIFFVDISFITSHFKSCVKQDFIPPHVVLFMFFQTFSFIFAGFSYNTRVSSRFCALSTSNTSHLYKPKLCAFKFYHINLQVMDILHILYNKGSTPIGCFFGHFSLQILSTKQVKSTMI